MAEASETEEKQNGTVVAQDAALPEAAEGVVAGGGGQIDVLLDVIMSVEAKLGEVKIQARDLVQAGIGSVLKLDRQIGEPVDLLLDGTRFAAGTVVVVGEHLGVKITEIVPAANQEASQPEEG